jgi:hypothetical protein
MRALNFILASETESVFIKRPQFRMTKIMVKINKWKTFLSRNKNLLKTNRLPVAAPVMPNFSIRVAISLLRSSG